MKKIKGFKILQEEKWIIIIFLTGMVFIYSTYAWFSSTLNVKISNFNMVTDSKAGLYISLDGIEWGEEISISKEIIINNLLKSYPSHTNQWSTELEPVSTIGLNNSLTNRFTFYKDNNFLDNKGNKYYRDFISPISVLENEYNSEAPFIAFDVFLKNVSGSPKSDNLYLGEDTKFEIVSKNDENIINAMRIGMVFMDSVSLDASANQIQNASCRGKCNQFIYEPNSTSHTDDIIDIAKKYDIYLTNGVKYPTYAIINGGEDINIWSGIYNSSVQFDNNSFSLQDTGTDLGQPIAKLPNGIMKIRVYIWIEGQDIDIVKYISDGYTLKCAFKFEKDMAGYE